MKKPLIASLAFIALALGSLAFSASIVHALEHTEDSSELGWRPAHLNYQLFDREAPVGLNNRRIHF